MTRTLSAFSIEIPDGFAERATERGLLFVGPAGEVLRLEEAAVAGGGPEAQQRLVRDRLVQGAIRDVQRDACQPDLETVVPLSRAPGAAGLETWNLVSRSPAGRLLAQAVVASDAGVAVLAWEGRTTQGSVERWFGVLEAIRPAGS
jgi:hypothetical protein